MIWVEQCEYITVLGSMSYLIHNGYFTEKGRYLIFYSQTWLPMPEKCSDAQSCQSNMYPFDLPWYYCMMEPANLSQNFFNLEPFYLIFIQ